MLPLSALALNSQMQTYCFAQKAWARLSTLFSSLFKEFPSDLCQGLFILSHSRSIPKTKQNRAL